MAAWARDLEKLAAAPNVTCKVERAFDTNLPRTAARDDVIGAIGVLFDLFGPDRLLWGSDWPVLTLAGDYHGWFELAREAIAAKEFGRRARRDGRQCLARLSPAAALSPESTATTSCRRIFGTSTTSRAPSREVLGTAPLSSSRTAPTLAPAGISSDTL